MSPPPAWTEWPPPREEPPRRGERQEALVAYRDALQAGHPSPGVAVETALLLHDLGDVDQARGVFATLAGSGEPAVEFLIRSVVAERRS